MGRWKLRYWWCQYVDHLTVALRVFLPSAILVLLGLQKILVLVWMSIMLRADDDEVGAILGKLQPINWQSNIHDHGAVFVKQLRQSLESRFPKARRGPRKSFMSDETWNTRGARRLVRRQTFHRRRLNGQMLGRLGRLGEKVLRWARLWQVVPHGAYCFCWPICVIGSC